MNAHGLGLELSIRPGVGEGGEGRGVEGGKGKGGGEGGVKWYLGKFGKWKIYFICWEKLFYQIKIKNLTKECHKGSGKN